MNKNISLLLMTGVLASVMAITACAQPPQTPSQGPLPTPAMAFMSMNLGTDDVPSGADVKIFANPVNPGLLIDTGEMDVVYYFDVLPPAAAGQSALTAAGTYTISESRDRSITWKSVGAGEHVFSAQLVNANDDTPLSEPAVAECLLAIPAHAQNSPEIDFMSIQSYSPVQSYFTAPFATTSPPAYEVTVTIGVANLTLDDDHIGGTNTAGHGHVIYYVDVEPPTTPGQPASAAQNSSMVTADTFRTWTNLAPGQHTFSVQLVNNDNTPLDPPVVVKMKTSMPSAPYYFPTTPGY
jgi:hypothetical protein